MFTKPSIILIPLLFILSFPALSQFTIDSYALHRISLIDVIHKRVLENQTVVIQNGVIVGIHDAEEFNSVDSLQLLTYDGYYLTPGLIDAHVHLGTDPSKSDNLGITTERLEYLLRNGVTTVRDMAGDARYLSYLSRQAMLDEIISPDIFYSSLIAGESFFRDPRTKLAARGFDAGQAPWMRAINSSSNLDQIMAEAKGTGATGVKIYADLNKDHITNVVEAAHQQGLIVWAHSTVFPARSIEVCEAGVDVMSHATYLAWEGENEIPSDARNRHRTHENYDINNPVYTKLMNCVSNNQTILDATIATYSGYFPDSTLFTYGVTLTNLAYKNNIKIGVGTDMAIDIKKPSPIFQEMQVLQDEVGMRPIDVINSATMVNAEMIGKEESIGSIEIGKTANLIVSKKNPAQDVSNFQTAEVIIKNGKLYDTFPTN